MRLKILLFASAVALGGGALYMVEGKQETPKPKASNFKVATAAITSITRTVRLTGQTSA